VTAWLFVIPKNPIAFVMRIPQEQTIAASAIAAAIVLVVFYSDHMAETRPSMENRF
jgi:hypothetical protein